MDTDVTDFCLIQFGSNVSTDFFHGSAYPLAEGTICSSVEGEPLMIAGVLKEKSRIDCHDISPVYCRLELSDAGPTSDPFLRNGAAQVADPEFSSVTGISGSPVFNLSRNRLCGVVFRGGLAQRRLNVLYAEASDLLHFVEAGSEGKPDTFYVKRLGNR